MSGYFCGKCGISAGTKDVFCHRCGSELNIQATPNTEYAASQRKICPQCGESVPMGDQFCGKCGTGQITPGFNTHIHTKRRAVPSGVTTHRRKRGFVFKLMSALVFWGVVIGALFAVYKFLGSDIPWSEVIAVVAGSEPQTGNVSLTVTEETGGYSEDLLPIAPGTPDSDNLPAPQEFIIQEGQVPQPKPEWGTQDASGYSVLVLPGQDSVEGADISLRGVVRGANVNLRAEPNTRSRRLGQFSSGKEFDVTRRFWSGRERFFWYGVSSGEDNGWMFGEYLRIEEE
jgi:ribosomal protein S27AE